jgi:hypothetical protein
MIGDTLQARAESQEVPQHEDDDDGGDRRDHPWPLRAPSLEQRFGRWRRNLRIGGGTAAAITDECFIGDLGLAEAALQYKLLETEKAGETGSHGENRGNGGNGEFVLDLTIFVIAVTTVIPV